MHVEMCPYQKECDSHNGAGLYICPEGNMGDILEQTSK